MFEILRRVVIADPVVVLARLSERLGIDGLKEPRKRRSTLLENLATAECAFIVAKAFLGSTFADAASLVFGDFPRVDEVIKVFSWFVVGLYHFIMILVVVGTKETCVRQRPC